MNKPWMYPVDKRPPTVEEALRLRDLALSNALKAKTPESEAHWLDHALEWELYAIHHT